MAHVYNSQYRMRIVHQLQDIVHRMGIHMFCYFPHIVNDTSIVRISISSLMKTLHNTRPHLLLELIHRACQFHISITI